MQIYYDVTYDLKNGKKTESECKCFGETIRDAEDFIKSLPKGTYYALRLHICDDDFQNDKISYLKDNYNHLS